MRVSHLGAVAEITSLPGCSQIVVIHASHVKPSERGKGLGKAAHQARLAVVSELGYDCALCTVRMDNDPQLKILQANGWKFAGDFLSSNTEHRVGIFLRILKDE